MNSLIAISKIDIRESCAFVPEQTVTLNGSSNVPAKVSDDLLQ
jgi:hypothetical protein